MLDAAYLYTCDQTFLVIAVHFLYIKITFLKVRKSIFVLSYFTNIPISSNRAMCGVKCQS